MGLATWRSSVSWEREMKTLRGTNSRKGGVRRRRDMLAFEEFLCRGGEKQDRETGRECGLSEAFF